MRCVAYRLLFRFDGLIEIHDQFLIIFLDGDDGNGFYVVLEGKVKVSKLSAEGKEQILHIFGPGEPFGEVPVFAGKPFPANAQALAKVCWRFFQKTALSH